MFELSVSRSAGSPPGALVAGWLLTLLEPLGNAQGSDSAPGLHLLLGEVRGFLPVEIDALGEGSGVAKGHHRVLLDVIKRIVLAIRLRCHHTLHIHTGPERVLILENLAVHLSPQLRLLICVRSGLRDDLAPQLFSAVS